MFEHRRDTLKKKSARKGPSADTAVTIITNTCRFVGKLYCQGSSRIGGKVEGQIISEGMLIIEDEAEISGEIYAEEAVIQGHVRGKIEAKTRVELCASSLFEGDIASPILVINEGARFYGRSVMLDGGASSPHFVSGGYSEANNSEAVMPALDAATNDLNHLHTPEIGVPS